MVAGEYERELDADGGAWESLPDRERWTMIQAWREVYAAPLHAATGRWKVGQFEWEIFSFGHVRALHGQRARAAYAGEDATAVVICPESARLPAVRYTARELPDFRGLNEDLVIFPEDLTWTMAFTHEEDSWGLGPYFCRREWVGTQTHRRPRRRR